MRLLELTKQIYPYNQTLACYLEVVSKINPDVLRVGFSALRQKGKLEPIDLAKMIFRNTDKNSR